MKNVEAPPLNSRDLEHIQKLSAVGINQTFMSSRYAMAPTPSGDRIQIRMGERLELWARQPLTGLLVLRVVRMGRLIVVTPADLLEFDMKET